MRAWPKHPVIYEIHTWVWLYELSQRYHTAITLDNVPPQEWEAIAALGVDAVWCMGVWERSPAGLRLAQANAGLQAEFRRVLPDYTPADLVGSPYCVRRYVVDAHLGGPEALATARQQLAQYGLRLLLDFVPNHVAPDHPWVTEHPEYFIQGDTEDLRRAPDEFFEAGGNVLAHGRDPYFPPWPDVAQLNVFHPGLRQAAIETVGAVAAQCDGMRCDMAMLLITHIFAQTWGQRAGTPPAAEFWAEVIPAVRQHYPNTRFIAEAYWDREWELQQQGFDYCYDKRLYDRLEHDMAESVRLHLCADLAYQEKLVRFIENHDEPRAAATFPAAKARAVAVTVATLPGAKLLHDGQLEGRTVKVPVFLRRRPTEPIDEALRAFYHCLLTVIKARAFRQGEWRLCERSGWPDNLSFGNVVAWCWRAGRERHVLVVNLSDSRSQARIRLPWEDLAGRSWRLTDAFSGEVYERDGNVIRDPGLYVDLDAWGFHCLQG